MLPGSKEGLVYWKECDEFGDRVLSEYFGVGEIRVTDEDIDLMTADALVWSHVINWWYNLVTDRYLFYEINLINCEKDSITFGDYEIRMHLTKTKEIFYPVCAIKMEK